MLDLLAAVGGDGHDLPGGGFGDLVGLAEPGALEAGPAPLAGARRRQLMQHRVAGQPARPRHVLWQVPQRFAVVGRVSDDVHHPVRERCGEQFDQRGGGFHFGGAGALAGQVQPGEYRQAHVAGAERQLHDDPGGDEAVAVADLARRRAASVMLPARSPDLASPPPEHRVIDRYHQVRARFHQCQDHQCGGRQAQLVNLPAGPGEEVVRAVVWPHPRQAGPSSMPTTVRRRTCPARPATRPQNVPYPGAVKHRRSGASTASREAVDSALEASADSLTRGGYVTADASVFRQSRHVSQALPLPACRPMRRSRL